MFNTPTKRVFFALALFLGFAFTFITLFKTKSHPYQLSILTIFQNEDRFLKEWIDYHQLLGVEHFYLFNHLSTDKYLSVLEPYIEAGVVELHDWPYVVNSESEGDFVKIQSAAYREGINFAKGQSKWLAIVDTDEFLLPMNKDNLVDFLKDYENYSGILINWQMFGTSNVQRIPDDRFLIEMLTQQAPLEIGDNTFCKSIVRPECVKYCVDAHTVVYYPWSCSCDPDGYAFLWKFHRSHPVKIDKIRINHYWTRDEDFFYERKISRKQFLDDPEQHKKKCIERNKLFNQVYNSEILRFVPLLRNKS